MASDVPPKPRREILQANALIRRRNRDVRGFWKLVFTLALIRSEREGNKIPRRIREMPKTGVFDSRPFSNLFNVAASRSAQMTTVRYLRLARSKVKPLERRPRSCRFAAHFFIRQEKEDGTTGMSRRSRPRAGGAAREDSGLREERIAREAHSQRNAFAGDMGSMSPDPQTRKA